VSWDPSAARRLHGPALCAYASRLIGADSRLVLWGGGNSSIKTVEKGGPVVWVKATGFDMKSITERGFTGMRLEELLALRAKRRMTDDDMVAAQLRARLDAEAAKPSIETLLHAWVPARHVYHTHADAVAGFTCAPGSRERTREAFGGEVLWVPYVRPGFDLAKSVAEAVERQPRARAMILDKHGALTWGDDAREAYEEMISLTRRALQYQEKRAKRPRVCLLKVSARDRKSRALEIMPEIRREHSQGTIVHWDDSAPVLRFLSRPDARSLSRRGPFAPDHTLQTKSRPLFWRPRGSIRPAMAAYRRWYASYFKKYAPRGTPRLDPNPRIILVPGVGLFATGPDPRRARIPWEIYRHTIEVMERVEAFSRYTPLDAKNLADMEFWPLETRKYALAPKEGKYSRKVALVAGLSRRNIKMAGEFCAGGGSVVLGDWDKRRARRVERELEKRHGRFSAMAVTLDVRKKSSLRRAFVAGLRAYGGVDYVFTSGKE
jgi:rhamnose utilization protein RhaD (predicted bifunctional aldolase and dehydrogenase)